MQDKMLREAVEEKKATSDPRKKNEIVKKGCSRKVTSVLSPFVGGRNNIHALIPWGNL